VTWPFAQPTYFCDDGSKRYRPYSFLDCRPSKRPPDMLLQKQDPPVANSYGRFQKPRCQEIYMYIPCRIRFGDDSLTLSDSARDQQTHFPDPGGSKSAVATFHRPPRFTGLRGAYLKIGIRLGGCTVLCGAQADRPCRSSLYYQTSNRPIALPLTIP